MLSPCITSGARCRGQLPRLLVVSAVSPPPSLSPPCAQQAPLYRFSPHHSSLSLTAGALTAATQRRFFCTSQSPLHTTTFARYPHTPTPTSHTASMTTEDCQGYDEALRVFSELGYDVYVHPHVDREEVPKVVQDINDSGHPCVPSKTMFMKSKKGELVMVVALQSTETDMKRIHRETATRNLHFASPEVLMENLHVVPGCVTPFSLIMNVDKKNVILLVDKNLIESPLPFVMRPCRNDRSAVLSFPELKAFLDKLGYAYKVVDFDVELLPEEAVSSPTTKKGGAPKEKKKKDAPAAENAEEGSPLS